MARRHEKRASKIWDSGTGLAAWATGGELWVGGWEDAKSGLDGWAELIINCANEDYAFPYWIQRSCSGLLACLNLGRVSFIQASFLQILWTLCERSVPDK